MCKSVSGSESGGIPTGIPVRLSGRRVVVDAGVEQVEVGLGALAVEALGVALSGSGESNCESKTRGPLPALVGNGPLGLFSQVSGGAAVLCFGRADRI